MAKKELFTQVIQEHQGILYKITKLYTDQEEDQKDLYQEIVFQLWKGFSSFRGEAKISTWMYRIALNTALLHLKRKKRRGHSVALDGVALAQEIYDPVMEERLKVLYAHIRKLGDMDKGIIFLFLEGRKYEEIASITGITASNVATRMSRIKDKLRAQLKK